MISRVTREAVIIIGGGAAFAVTLIGASQLFLSGSGLRTTLGLASRTSALADARPACIRDTAPASDEIYFLSCGGIF